VEVTVLILFRAEHPWIAPAMGIATVMLGGAVGAGMRAKPNQRPLAQIAEVSAAELSGLQVTAIAQGVRSIDTAPIAPRLDRDSRHFLMLRQKRRRKGVGAPMARCVALFYLRDGTARIGQLELEDSVFGGLAQVGDAGRVEQIVRQGARARVYTSADREGRPG
jgi:hypothetical protein